MFLKLVQRQVPVGHREVIGDVHWEDFVRAVVLREVLATQGQDIVSLSGHVALILAGKTVRVAGHRLHTGHGFILVYTARRLQFGEDLIYYRLRVVGGRLTQQAELVHQVWVHGADVE